MADPERVGRASYLLVFDGGSRGGRQLGFGSYLLETPEGRIGPIRRRYGPGVTNNQAEYLALLDGLRQLLVLSEESGRRKEEIDLEVRGDSRLVINQLAGRWRVRHPALRPLFDEARQMLAGFRQARLRWTPRAASVDILGH